MEEKEYTPTFVRWRERWNEEKKKLLFNNKTKEINHIYLFVTNILVVHQWQHLKKWTHTYIHTILFLFFFSVSTGSLLVTTNWKKVSKLTFEVYVCVLCTIRKTYSSLGFFTTQGEIKHNMNILKKSKRNTWILLCPIELSVFSLIFHFSSSLSLSCIVHNQFFFLQCHANCMIQSFINRTCTFYMTYLSPVSNKM